MLRFLFITILSIALSSCNLHSLSQGIQLNAVHFLNPDKEGSAKPVAVTVLQLSDPSQFKVLSFELLTNKSQQYLGKNLIDKQSFEIRPGGHKKVFIQLSKDTKYLGIISGYRKLNNIRWRKLIKIMPEHQRKNVMINLNSEQMQIYLK